MYKETVVHEPDMRELVAFVEVARQLNFTRAAASLCVSVPSFSQTLRGLEEKLGLRLRPVPAMAAAISAAMQNMLQCGRPEINRVRTSIPKLPANEVSKLPIAPAA